MTPCDIITLNCPHKEWRHISQIWTWGLIICWIDRVSIWFIHPWITSETESVYKNRYTGLLLAIYKSVRNRKQVLHSPDQFLMPIKFKILIPMPISLININRHWSLLIRISDFGFDQLWASRESRNNHEWHVVMPLESLIISKRKIDFCTPSLILLYLS